MNEDIETVAEIRQRIELAVSETRHRTSIVPEQILRRAIYALSLAGWKVVRDETKP